MWMLIMGYVDDEGEPTHTSTKSESMKIISIKIYISLSHFRVFESEQLRDD